MGTWPTNVVSLSQFGTDVTTLVNAEAAVASKTGTTATRDEALAVVLTDIHALKSMVQLKANANPSNAAGIIVSAGFFVANSATKAKRQNEALNTEVLGTVLLTADMPGHHEWEQSPDMITPTNLPATTTSQTKVTGLVPGAVWYFRNRKVNTKKTTYNWCAWIRLVIGAGGKTAGGSTSGRAGSLPTA